MDPQENSTSDDSDDNQPSDPCRKKKGISEPMDHQEDSTSDDSDDNEPSNPCEEKKGRSASQCNRVTKMRDGERKMVYYNSKGQPIGDSKSDLASYEGLIAKKVRITYENWKAVPKGVKKKCWKALKAKFVLSEDERRTRVSAIGASWKKFKSTLTTKYIRPFEDDLEQLRYPPEKYEKIIPQNDWEVFLKQRISDEFKRLSEKQSARQKKKLYNHRTSKRGYAGLAEELKMKLGPKFDENNRSLLWKEAHKDKKGLYPDDAIKEVAEKIVIAILVNRNTTKLRF